MSDNIDMEIFHSHYYSMGHALFILVHGRVHRGYYHVNLPQRIIGQNERKVEGRELQDLSLSKEIYSAALATPHSSNSDHRLAYTPQHFLYFLPLPQGQGLLRPTLPAATASFCLACGVMGDRCTRCFVIVTCKMVWATSCRILAIKLSN